MRSCHGRDSSDSAPAPASPIRRPHEPGCANDNAEEGRSILNAMHGSVSAAHGTRQVEEPASFPIRTLSRKKRSRFDTRVSRSTSVIKAANGVDILGDAHNQPVEGPCRIPDCAVSPELRALFKIVGHGSDSIIQSCRDEARPVRDPPNSITVVGDNNRSPHSPSDLTDSGYVSQDDIEDDTVAGEELHWKIYAIECTTPPVTTDNLKELELPAIQNTLSLRIDLCFDHDLFFQRISGPKGEEKRIKAKIYYQCLTLELQAILHVLKGTCDHCTHTSSAQYYLIPSRLGKFFHTLRDLLGLLVPDNEKEEVMQRVNVDSLTREVRVGLFDAVTFFNWLCGLITSHCAPMRDEMAQAMREKTISGATDGNMPLLVEGLETLLNLLENMKIDVANHQVRSFKLLLIADTIPFLRDCFSKMIENGQFEVTSSRQWFKTLRKHEDVNLAFFASFTTGLVGLCCQPNQHFPNTFNYDKDRLQILRNDIFDVVQLEICLETFKSLFQRLSKRQPFLKERRELYRRLVHIITSEDGVVEGVDQHRTAVATELARAAAGIEPDKMSKHMTDLAKLDADSAKIMLRDNLGRLHDHFLNRIMQQLQIRTLSVANDFSKLPDTLAISNSQRAWSIQRCEQGVASMPDLEDISRRLAHIAVIHWQVWSDLVYLEPDPALRGDKPLPCSSGDSLP